MRFLLRKGDVTKRVVLFFSGGRELQCETKDVTLILLMVSHVCFKFGGLCDNVKIFISKNF